MTNKMQYSANGPTQSYTTSVPRNHSYVTVMGALASAAIFVSASSPATATSISPARLQSGSNSIMFVAREEDAKLEAGALLSNIKSTSGLTWAEIGMILGVTRRAVYDWTKKGAKVRAGNLAKLSELFERVKRLEGEPKFKIRQSVLQVASENTGVLPHQHGDTSPILTSDHRPARHKLKVSETSSLKIVRQEAS